MANVCNGSKADIACRTMETFLLGFRVLGSPHGAAAILATELVPGNLNEINENGASSGDFSERKPLQNAR